MTTLLVKRLVWFENGVCIFSDYPLHMYACMQGLNGSLLAKLKKSIPLMLLLWNLIYRVEAVGLKNYNYTYKITIYVIMSILVQCLEKSIFLQ